LLEKNLKLWGVVNNAGIVIGAFVDWASMASFRKVFEVNFFGAVVLTKLLLPLLKRTRNSRVINVSSMAGFLGGPGFSSYSCKIYLNH
jgi:short-subunit dehydrogenase